MCSPVKEEAGQGRAENQQEEKKERKKKRKEGDAISSKPCSDTKLPKRDKKRYY
jgi:hypothetical protein